MKCLARVAARLAPSASGPGAAGGQAVDLVTRSVTKTASDGMQPCVRGETSAGEALVRPGGHPRGLLRRIVTLDARLITQRSLTTGLTTTMTTLGTPGTTATA
jgi:hypothetical protein